MTDRKENYCGDLWGEGLIVNTLTPTSDQHVTSLHNFHVLSSKQVMRILKLIR